MNFANGAQAAGHPGKQRPGVGPDGKPLAAKNQIKPISIGQKAAQASFELKIPDNEAIGLFINFYKLLFLGSDFAKKMLKIQIDGNSSGDKNILFDSKNKDQPTDDELSDGKFMYDTTDLASSDQQNLDDLDHDVVHEGSVKAEGDLDPYQKIKVHANLALRHLLKNNSKILFNYWNIMFPSFMVRP